MIRVFPQRVTSRIVGLCLALVVTLAASLWWVLAPSPPRRPIVRQADTYFDQGVDLVARGRYRAAEEHYRSIAEREPENFYPRWALAVLYIDYLDEYEMGLRELSGVESLAPAEAQPSLSPMVTLYRGRALDGLGDYDGAIGSYEAYLRSVDRGYFLAVNVTARVHEIRRARDHREKVPRELFSMDAPVTWIRTTPFH